MTVPAPPATFPATPSALRSRVSLGFTAAAAVGHFELQVCSHCETAQYPPRETCHRCLSDRLVWRPQSGAGELLSRTVLHHSHDPYFRQRLPWPVGMVRLDAGPTVLVHLPAEAPTPPARVWVRARLDRGGMGVLVASERKDGADLNNDTRLQEMTSDPKDAHILVTDGASAHSRALVRALGAAGASRIWVGYASLGQPVEMLAGLRDVPHVKGLRLDVTDKGCVREAASLVGNEIDILINTADVRYTGTGSESKSAAARSEMEIHYFGLLNLAKYFAPCLLAPSARSPRLCPAWINVLSIFALSGFPPWETYSASMAAAHSLSRSLRARMRDAGVRLVTVFPGPLEDERSLGLQQPKLSPSMLAKSIVEALRTGVEEVYPGDVAQEWVAGVLDRRRLSDSAGTAPR